MKYNVFKQKLLKNKTTLLEKRLLKLRKIMNLQSLVLKKITKLEKDIKNLSYKNLITIH